MKILITGGSGFIGSNLAEYLKKIHEVYIPSSRELDLKDESAVYDYLSLYRFDIVIHTAILTEHKYPQYANILFEANLRMFFNLKKYSHLYGKMLYFGSGAEYDMRNYKSLMDEDYFGEHIPVDKYGFAKYIMSKQLECEDSQNTTCLRIFAVFGKNEEWDRRFISNSICRVLFGKPIEINQNVFFDYMYINDLCRIVDLFMENTPQYRHYNVCTSKPIDLFTLAEIIKNITGSDQDILVKKNGLKLEYSGNNGRLLNEFSDITFTKIDVAIAELFGWYKQNLSLIDPSKLI